MTERLHPVIPTGEQIEIGHGDQRACVVEVGGGLRSYRIGDRHLLDGYAAEEVCTDARGQALLPWPNRLRDGRYVFVGAEHQLPLTEPGKHNAIHGLTRWANWVVVDRADDQVTMTYLLHPQDGYPFALHLAISYRVADGGLSVRTTATNVGTTPGPYGAGAHPYLTVGTPTTDSVVLRAPGQTWLPVDEQGIPTGTEPVDDTEYDFRTPHTIRATRLDTAYTNLGRSADGVARVELLAPEGGDATTLWVDAAYPYLMLFTGDTLPEVGRRRRSLGVEPMTCAPNAFASGDGLQTLLPGQSFASSWGLTPTTTIEV